MFQNFSKTSICSSFLLKIVWYPTQEFLHFFGSVVSVYRPQFFCRESTIIQITIFLEIIEDDRIGGQTDKRCHRSRYLKTSIVSTDVEGLHKNGATFIYADAMIIRKYWL